MITFFFWFISVFVCVCVLFCVRLLHWWTIMKPSFELKIFACYVVFNEILLCFYIFMWLNQLRLDPELWLVMMLLMKFCPLGLFYFGWIQINMNNLVLNWYVAEFYSCWCCSMNVIVGIDYNMYKIHVIGP